MTTIGGRTVIDIDQKLVEVVIHGAVPLSCLICLILLTPRLQNRLQKYRISLLKNAEMKTCAPEHLFDE
jgi:hypothetical protein